MLSSNFISMLISVITVLLIPKVVGDVAYGYIQLYIFYVGYTSYFSFGATDGIYIRYGGRSLDNIDKSLIANQFWFMSILLMLISTIGMIVVCEFSANYYNNLLIFWALVSALVSVPRSIITFTLLATNNIKDNAMTTMIERVSYFVLVCILLVFNIQSFELYVYADIVGKCIATIYIVIRHMSLIKGSLERIKESLVDFGRNIYIGIKIVLSGIVGMLIIGTVRFGISNIWDVSIFGKVSLSLSISNLLMVFINAIALVIFPVICRSSQEELRDSYHILDNMLQIILAIIMAFYYPMKEILCIWLPQYEDGLIYMALLFPLCLFECKVALVLNPYLKATRQENGLFIANLFAALISCICTFITIYLLKSLTLAVASIIFLLAVRCTLLQIILHKKLRMKTNNMILDFVLCIAFILSNWVVGSYGGFLLYLAVVIIFIIFRKSVIKELYKKIRLLVLK